LQLENGQWSVGPVVLIAMLAKGLTYRSSAARWTFATKLLVCLLVSRFAELLAQSALAGSYNRSSEVEYIDGDHRRDVSSLTLSLEDAVSRPAAFFVSALDRAVGSVGAARLASQAAVGDELWRDGSRGLSFRRLASFDDLNALLATMVLQIPDPPQIVRLGSWLKIDLSDIKCSQISIEDLSVVATRRTLTLVEFDIDLRGLATACTLSWRYRATPFRGSGTAAATASGSDLDTKLHVTSQYAESLPTSVSVPECVAAITVDSLSFSGGIVAAIANAFKGAVEDLIVKEVSKLACKELVALDDEIVGFVSKLTGFLGPHIPCRFGQGSTTTINGDEVQVCLPVADIRNPDPLYGEIPGSPTLGDPMQLINFQDSSLVRMATNMVNDYLGVLKNETLPDGSVREDLGVNIAIREFTEGDGQYSINPEDFEFAKGGVLYDGHDLLTHTTISIVNITLQGLDTFTELDPLRALSNWTLGSRMEMSGVNVTAVVDLQMRSNESVNLSAAPEIHEQISVTIGLEGMKLAASVLLAIEKAKVEQMQVGSMLDSAFSCSLSTARAINVTALAVTVAGIIESVTTGAIEEGLDKVFISLAEGMFLLYEVPVVQAVPNLFQTSVREALNKKIWETIAEQSCLAQPPPLIEQPQYFDFQTSEKFQWLRENLLGNFAPDQSKDGINKGVIGPATESMNPQGEPGVIWFQNTLVNFSNTSENFGKFDLRLFDARVSGLDTVYEMEILKPAPIESGANPYFLSNAVGIGRGEVDPATGKPEALRGSLDALLSIQGGPATQNRGIYNNLTLSVELFSMQVLADLLLQIDVTRVLFLRVIQLTHPACYLSTIRPGGVDLTNLAINFGEFDLHLDCHSCTSPGLLELSDNLKKPAVVAEMTGQINELMQRLVNYVQSNDAMSTVNDLIGAAPIACDAVSPLAWPGTPIQADEDPIDTLRESPGSVIGVIILCTAVACALCFCCSCCIWRVATQDPDPLAENTRALICSSCIPICVRLLVPIILFINILFFVSGHVSLAATVDVTITIAGEKIEVSGFHSFSMAQSVIELVDAGAYELALLILLASGVWPYSRLIIMIASWFAPTECMYPKTRTCVYSWLDALGKWSMLDIFVLDLALLIFYMEITSPRTWNFVLPPGFLQVLFRVTPGWGLYANLIAQILSQLVSHVIIHYNRKVCVQGYLKQKAAERKGNKKNNEDDSDSSLSEEELPLCSGEKEALCAHKYDVGERSFSLRCCGQFIPVAVFAATVCLIVAGCAYNSFATEVIGLVGVVLVYGEGASRHVYTSVFDAVASLGRQAQGSVASFIGLYTLAFIFVLCVMVVPILQIFTLTLLWILPTTHGMQRLLLHANEVLASWQYLEVYMLAIVVTIIQMPQLSVFMVGDDCDGILNILAKLVEGGILEFEPEHDVTKCFQISVGFRIGSLFLLIASILLFLNTSFVLHMARSAQKENGEVAPIEEHSCTFVNLTAGCSTLCICCAKEGKGSKHRHRDQAEDGTDTTSSYYSSSFSSSAASSSDEE